MSAGATDGRPRERPGVCGLLRVGLGEQGVNIRSHVLADESGKSLDGGRRIGPVADEGGIGDGLPRGEPGERGVDAELSAPLVKTHPEFLPKSRLSVRSLAPTRVPSSARVC